jgi:mannose-6-phosphate isomerase-like protein (cupin superfamily)
MAGEFFLPHPGAAVGFGPVPTRHDCFRSARLFLGLNALARGQAQRVHAHDRADKFYLVLSGKARFVVGDASLELGPGGIAWAPAGVPHGVDEALEDSILLVGMAPPP